jgi:glycosyltransferase involved in cell wall biosynthesis
LDSIYTQTASSWEIIIIDGVSSDATQDIIRQNAARLAYWISEPDRGVYDAWNKAIAHATADWVIFLGADDSLWNDQILAAMEPVLRDAPPECRLVYGQVAITDEQNQLIRFAGKPWDAIVSQFDREMCIPHQGVFHRRRLFRDARFDVTYRYAGDYALLFTEARNRSPLFVDLCISSWRQGGLTSRPADSIRVLKEFRRVHKENGMKPDPLTWTELKAWVKFGTHKVLGKGLTGKLLLFWRLRFCRNP